MFKVLAILLTFTFLMSCCIIMVPQPPVYIYIQEVEKDKKGDSDGTK